MITKKRVWSAVRPARPVWRIADIDVLYWRGAEELMLLASGPIASVGVVIGEDLAGRGIGVTVVAPRPGAAVTPVLAHLCDRHWLALFVRIGPVQDALIASLRHAVVRTFPRILTLPAQAMRFDTSVTALSDVLQAELEGLRPRTSHPVDGYVVAIPSARENES